MGNLIYGVIAPVSILIPLLIALSKFRRLHAALKTIVYYLILGGIINVAGILLAKNGINNMPLAHGYTLAEASLLFYFFSKLMLTEKSVRLVKITWLLFTVFFVMNLIFFQGIFTYNSYSRSLEALIMLVLCIFFFYQQLQLPDPGEKAWYVNPLLWIVTGFFLYFSGALFLFIFSELISHEMALYRLGWTIHALLVIAMYVLFAIAFSQPNLYKLYI